MALTDKQVRFKLGRGSVEQTQDNGTIIFDGENKKIFTQGYMFDCKNVDTHAINTLDVFVDGQPSTSFNQVLDASINFVAGEGIELERGISPNTITINATGQTISGSVSRLDVSALIGSNNNFTYFRNGGPVASNANIGDSNTPVYLSGGVFQPCVSYPTVNNASFKITTDNADNKIVDWSNNSAQEIRLQFLCQDNIHLETSEGKITVGVASGYKIPKDASLKNFQECYTWYKTTDFTTGGDVQVYNGKLSFGANDVSVRIFGANQQYDVSVNFKNGDSITVTTDGKNNGNIVIGHGNSLTSSVFSTKSTTENTLASNNKSFNVVTGVSRDRFGHINDVSVTKVNLPDAAFYEAINESKPSSLTTRSYSANIERETLFWYDMD